MTRASFVLLVALLGMMIGSRAEAQLRAQPLSESRLNELGLETVWQNQVLVDTTKSAIGGATLQVVGLDSLESLQKTSQVAYEVSLGEKKYRFRENDLDTSGQPLGRVEAERLANKQKILLEARGGKATLVTRSVPALVLYVATGQGAVHAMDAESGRTLWATHTGNPTAPTLAPGANDRFVCVINGSRLHLLDRQTGAPIWDRPLDHNPSTGVQVSSNMAFVPGLDGEMTGYKLPTELSDNRFATGWVYHSTGRITNRPLVTPNSLSWATEEGRMMVADVAGPTMSYRFECTAPIHGGVAFLPPDKLVVAATNGYVTALNQKSGRIEWEYSTGFAIDQTPFVSKTSTLVVTHEHELIALSNNDGSPQWTAEGVSRVLSASDKRIYALGRNGGLLVLDHEKGSLIGQLPLGGSNLSLSNAVSDRIYLASSAGEMICLREVGADYPTVRWPLPAEEQAPAPRKKPRPAAAKPSADAEGDDADKAEAGGDSDAGESDDSDPFAVDDGAAAEPAAEEPATEESAEEPAADEPTAEEAAPAEEADKEDADKEEGNASEDPFDFG
jgi:outer membrane protein assembly factor BamB